MIEKLSRPMLAIYASIASFIVILFSFLLIFTQVIKLIFGVLY